MNTKVARIATPTAKPAAQNVAVVGENIEAAVDGDILTLRIDLSQRLRKSASGKTTIVATTGGNQTIPGTTVIAGINLYVKG